MYLFKHLNKIKKMKKMKCFNLVYLLIFIFKNSYKKQIIIIRFKVIICIFQMKWKLTMKANIQIFKLN